MILINNFSEQFFAPKQSLAKRYSLESMASSRNLTIDEFKIQIEKEIKIRQQMIDDRLAKGYTYEQAENETMRCLYITWFCVATFKD